MRKLVLPVLAIGLAIFLADSVQAQQGGGGGGGGRGRGRGGFNAASQDPALLLLSKRVQDELKLTDAQKAEIKPIQDKYQDSMSKARKAGDPDQVRDARKNAVEEAKKDLDKAKGSLQPDQTKRLRQIQLQVQGLKAFNDEDVQKELKLSDKQKGDIKDITEGVAKDINELRQGAQGDRQKLRELFQKMDALNKEAAEKVNGVLTEEQKKTWTEMKGVKFEFRGGQGGGGRRPADRKPDNN